MFRLISLSLILLHLVYAELMASCLKRGLEELIEHDCRFTVGDETSREDDAVGIVMLTDEMCDFHVPHQTCTHTVMLVEGHCHTLARATDAYAAGYYSCFYIVRKGMGEVGIIARTVAICAVVFILHTFFL